MKTVDFYLLLNFAASLPNSIAGDNNRALATAICRTLVTSLLASNSVSCFSCFTFKNLCCDFSVSCANLCNWVTVYDGRNGLNS